MVAVAEFYERAGELNSSLAIARTKSWLAVVVVAASFFLVLSMIVFKGSRTIEKQRKVLNARVEELDQLLTQNKELANRVQGTAQKATALTERYLRRVSADLHDGPVQLMAYASMRIDSRAIRDGERPEPERSKEVDTIKQSLDDAIQEVRAICRGLALPDIEELPFSEVLERAKTSHQSRTGCGVTLTVERLSIDISPSARICIYRFVQEGSTTVANSMSRALQRERV